MSSLNLDNFRALAERFVSQMLQGNYEMAASQFDNQMKTAIPLPELKKSWQRLTIPAGDLIQTGVLQTAELEGHQIVSVRCQFERATIDVQVVFNSKGRVSGLSIIPSQTEYHPPDYVDDSAFREVEVTVGKGKWSLPGTITIPTGPGPFPGVVLVHGSGPNDRDETLGPNKIFRDIAWGLASKGMAVLRYDKRTLQHASEFTPELLSQLTVQEEVIDDALLAAELLRQTPEIDPKRVYLLGHSLGASVAPRIGQEDPDLAGLIIMAGIIRPLEDTILEQFTYLYSLAGEMTKAQKDTLESLKVKVARAKDPELSIDVPSKELPLGMSASYFLDLRNHPTTDIIKNLEMPMLILQGGRDYQVSPIKDFKMWKEELESREDVTCQLFPGLNHLFIEGEGKSTPTEYGVEGHVSEEVIETIINWLTEG
ncbi:MAG: alpha/beta fold hydrolase [Methanobacterium formicicum]